MVALDPNRKIAKRLNAKLMPTTILVDMDGVIRWIHQGYLPGDEEEIEHEMKRSSQTDLQKGLMLAGLMMFGGASALFVATLMQKA